MVYLFQALLFASEIVLWFGVGRVIYLLLQNDKAWSIAIGVLASVMMIAIWGMFFSPKAAYRLPKLPRTVLISALSISVGIGLYIRGDRYLGLTTLIALTLIQIIGQYFLSDS